MVDLNSMFLVHEPERRCMHGLVDFASKRPCDELGRAASTPLERVTASSGSVFDVARDKSPLRGEGQRSTPRQAPDYKEEPNQVMV
jgi:hypothetical protein